MARPLRIEFADAVYHVTTRGDRREPIYRDDADRRLHLALLAQAADRFEARVLAWCQMGNHFHLVLQTRRANLSRLMRHLNGVYTQGFNRRHGLAGHLFQGRFKAILVQREAYLLALCRYVERNPVAAGWVQAPADWAWSSCRAHLGDEPVPEWLDVDALHAVLLGRSVRRVADRRQAQALYADLVAQPVAAGFWAQGLRQQVFLGDEAFVESTLGASGPPGPSGATGRTAAEVPQVQRQRPAAGLQQCMAQGLGRDQALHRAYTEGGRTMTQLAAEIGLSISRVSRAIRAVEQGQAKNKT